jgi:hypothetical protein
MARPCRNFSSARGASLCLASTIATRPWLIALFLSYNKIGDVLEAATGSAISRPQHVADLAVRNREIVLPARIFRVGLDPVVGNSHAISVPFQRPGEIALRHQHVADLDDGEIAGISEVVSFLEL